MAGESKGKYSWTSASQVAHGVLQLCSCAAGILASSRGDVTTPVPTGRAYTPAPLLHGAPSVPGIGPIISVERSERLWLQEACLDKQLELAMQESEALSGRVCAKEAAEVLTTEPETAREKVTRAWPICGGALETVVM